MKKLLSIIGAVSLLTIPVTTVVACTGEYDESWKNEDFYNIPELDQQPKTLDETLDEYATWFDQREYWLTKDNEEWREYIATIPNWKELSSEEQLQIGYQFGLNSRTSQKSYIALFWKITWLYKISQFTGDEYYRTEIVTPMGYEETIYIYIVRKDKNIRIIFYIIMTKNLMIIPNIQKIMKPKFMNEELLITQIPKKWEVITSHFYFFVSFFSAAL